MLKHFPLNNIGHKAKEKCGEIFCHSSTDFTIYCTFCNMKAFTFQDFQLHVQNVHFDKNLLKPETFNPAFNQYLEVNIKNEVVLDATDQLQEEEVHYKLEQSFDEASEDEKEEIISVLRKSRKNVRAKRKKKSKPIVGNESNDEGSDNSSDEDFKPMLNEKISSGPKEKPYQCEHCDGAFLNPGLLKVHITRVHEEKSSDPIVKKEKTDKCDLVCPECDQVFSKIKDMDHHAVERHDGYKCALCDKRFKERRYVKRHELLYHIGGRVFQCQVGGCTKSYVVKRDLDRHQETHATERTFICNFENCDKAFHSKRQLQQHGAVHVKPKNLVCDTCGHTCRNVQMLKLHQRVHTGEKPYACEVCEKRFISPSALGEHMASHTNIRSHICKVCNASFARQKSLYHHSFIHSDVKKFKCKLCGMAYKQAAGLAGHMRKHREEGMVTVEQKPPVFNEQFPFFTQFSEP